MGTPRRILKKGKTFIKLLIKYTQEHIPFLNNTVRKSWFTFFQVNCANHLFVTSFCEDVLFDITY